MIEGPAAVHVVTALPGPGQHGGDGWHPETLPGGRHGSVRAQCSPDIRFSPNRWLFTVWLEGVIRCRSIALQEPHAEGRRHCDEPEELSREDYFRCHPEPSTNALRI
jgi:hypothetical protein